VIALHREGSSFLHRAPAWAKLAGFAVFALVVSVLGGDPRVAVGAAAIVVAGYLLAGPGFGLPELWRQLLVARLLIVLVAVGQLLFLPLEAALTGTLRITGLIVGAALVTLTTPMSELLAAMERALAPLRFLGLPPDRVALAIAMTITSIPVVAAHAASVREAHVARGLPPRIHRVVVPVLVLSLKHADDLADAIRARGLD